MGRIGVLVTSCILFGCSAQQHTAGTSSPQQSDTPLNDKHQPVQTQSLDWLDYADPVADANMAIDKGQYHLLAISSKGLSLPGVNLTEYKLEELQQRCKLKQLSTGGDAVYSKSQLEKGKAIVAYAKAYNQVALQACLKSTLN